jgi:branched-chain amino acid transport system permease protein
MRLPAPLKLLRHPLAHSTLVLAVLALWMSSEGFDSYNAFVAQLVCIYAIATMGLNIPGGYGGALSLGQGAAFALGAYTAAILASEHAWPFWATLPLGALVGLAFGIALGGTAGRLGIIGLAMVSLGAGLVLMDLVLELDGLTGGPAGVANVLPLASFGDDGLTGLATEDWLLSALILGSAYIAYLGHWWYRVSPRGRALLAIRDDELGAAASGISPYWERVLAFGVGSAYGAVAGGLFAYQSLFVSPESMTVQLSILLLAMMILGGAASRVGPIVGAAILGIVPLQLDQWPHVNVFVYGAMLLFIPLLRPRGILARSSVAVREPAPAAPEPAALAAEVPPAGEAVLRGRGLTKSFGGVAAVAEVDVDVRAGEVVGLIGPNGSGKTTLLNILSGFYPPDAGCVELRGRDTTGLPVSATSHLGVARTFQTPKVFPGLSLSEHMRLAREHAVAGSSGPARAAAAGAADRLLEIAGLSLRVRARQEARSLSHGQLRFLEVAMAIRRCPSLLLLDEPAAGLSSDEIAGLEAVVSSIARELGMGVIIVEHHLELVRSLADSVLVLNVGRTLWRGEPAELERAEVVREAYLGISA